MTLAVLVVLVVFGALGILDLMAGKGLSFDRCDRLDAFRSESWFESLKDAVDDAGVPLKSVSDVCYAPDAEKLALLVPGRYCEGSRVFKFDTRNGRFTEANRENHEKACVVSPREFGLQRGDSILLGGVIVDGSCNSVMSFEYDATTNFYELKSEYINCDGDLEGVWKEY